MPSPNEISELFDLHHSYNLLNLLSEIKNQYHDLSILNKQNKYIESDFIELIKFNINYKSFIKNK